MLSEISSIKVTPLSKSITISVAYLRRNLALKVSFKSLKNKARQLVAKVASLVHQIRPVTHRPPQLKLSNQGKSTRCGMRLNKPKVRRKFPRKPVCKVNQLRHLSLSLSITEGVLAK
jgi:hypothetical protein